MPPSGDIQHDVSGDVATILGKWAEQRDDFIFSTNEPGMHLGGESRGADAAIWLRSTVPAQTGKFRRVPPLLAVEIAGRDDTEATLREKAKWYFAHGVKVVWLVLPETREVVVEQPRRRRRFKTGERLAAHPELPDLTPDVARFFRQLR